MSRLAVVLDVHSDYLSVAKPTVPRLTAGFVYIFDMDLAKYIRNITTIYLQNTSERPIRQCLINRAEGAFVYTSSTLKYTSTDDDNFYPEE